MKDRMGLKINTAAETVRQILLQRMTHDMMLKG